MQNRFYHAWQKYHKYMFIFKIVTFEGVWLYFPFFILSSTAFMLHMHRHTPTGIMFLSSLLYSCWSRSVSLNSSMLSLRWHVSEFTRANPLPTFPRLHPSSSVPMVRDVCFVLEYISFSMECKKTLFFNHSDSKRMFMKDCDMYVWHNRNPILQCVWDEKH